VSLATLLLPVGELDVQKLDVTLAHADTEVDARRDREERSEPVGAAEAEAAALESADADTAPVSDAAPVGSATVADTLAVAAPLAVAVSLSVSVAEAATLTERQPVTVADSLGEPVPVPVREARADALTLGLAHALGVADAVDEREGEPVVVREMTGVREWVGEPVDDLLDVELALARGLKEGVFETIAVADALPVTVVDRVAEKQRVAAPDADGDADTAGESVAELLKDGLPESDAESVGVGVDVVETDARGEKVGDTDRLPLALDRAEDDAEPLVDGDVDSLGEGEAERDADAESVSVTFDDAVGSRVGGHDAALLSDSETVMVMETRGLQLSDAESDARELVDALAVELAFRDARALVVARETVGSAVCDRLGVCVTVPLALPLAAALAE